MDYYSVPVFSPNGLDPRGKEEPIPYNPTNWQFDPLAYSSFQPVISESGSLPNADFELRTPIINFEPDYNYTPSSHTQWVLERPAIGIPRHLPTRPTQDDIRRNRNRLAANRYRKKRQREIKQLEAKAQNLGETKETLQACRQVLQDEIFHLRNELLQHAEECHYGGSMLAVKEVGQIGNRY